MHGVNLGERWPYDAEISVMREMGWSWQDLCDAPFDIVGVIIAETNARSKWTRKADERNGQG